MHHVVVINRALHVLSGYPFPILALKMNSFYYKCLCLLLLSFFKDHHLCSADPTDGFTLVPLTEDNFKLQKPYNEPLDDRYSYKDGVRSFWIYNNDKPFKAQSTTRPRSELRISVSKSLPFSAYINSARLF